MFLYVNQPATGGLWAGALETQMFLNSFSIFPSVTGRGASFNCADDALAGLPRQNSRFSPDRQENKQEDKQLDHLSILKSYLNNGSLISNSDSRSQNCSHRAQPTDISNQLSVGIGGEPDC